ncbi:MAG: COQ9 family protein [Alphaproteobacteria bacterium]|nr:COQ9 family protein [Alphaproteobacteria bacterium]
MNKDSQGQTAQDMQDAQDKKTAQAAPVAQAAILDSALPALAVEGFTESVLDKAVVAAGFQPSVKRKAFPRGALDLAIYFIARGTDEMEKKLATMDLPAMKVRARITQAVRTRLEIDAADKDIVRKAAYFFAQPAHAKEAAKLLGATVDAMWRAAGDTSTDSNFYSKRAILSSVYIATRLFWLQDNSPNHRESWAFLDRRIENVMQIETGKAKFRELKKRFPDPLAVLARWRYGEKR